MENMISSQEQGIVNIPSRGSVAEGILRDDVPDRMRISRMENK
jgi:hypothetical protein